MVETSGSGVPVQKTLCHRKAVQPFFEQGSRWERVSATATLINSMFDLADFAVVGLHRLDFLSVGERFLSGDDDSVVLDFV